MFENRPAIIALDMVEEGFLRPSPDMIIENGVIGSLKPISDILIRDPQIYLGPEGIYYLTGTYISPNDAFGAPNPGIYLWSSTDLMDWKGLGLVWDVKKEGTWQNMIREKPSIWAPEIYYLYDTYWVTYSMAGQSTALLKSVTGKAEGPYVDMGRMTNQHIDSSFFVEDDGSVYYVWQDGKIAKMKSDMSGFSENPRQLLTVDNEFVGYEGIFLIKRDGKYILGAAEWNGDMRIDGTYDLMYAVSDNLFGPYSSRKVAIPHGGHGTMFVDKEGCLRSTFFGNDRTAPFRKRLGIVKLEMLEEAGEVIIRPVE